MKEFCTHLCDITTDKSMIDINLLRVEKGGNPDLVKESQRKRGASVQLIDDILILDKEWIKLKFEVDELNKEINKIQKEIAEKFKLKEDASILLQRKNDLDKEQKDKAAQLNAKDEQLRFKLSTVGNIVHSSVVDSKDEANNNIIRTWSSVTPQKGTSPATGKSTSLSHDQVLQRLDGYDPERGSNVSGHRGYFLKNIGVRLNQALINYGLDFLSNRQYTLLQTPFLMKKDVMAKTAQLEEFDEQLYKVIAEGEDEKYLIATSEQPISAFHTDEWFEQPSEQLPILYAGLSSCFRKEAGAHGKDTWGIFRVHQFEKVEQFVLTEPEKSWDMFDQMISTSEQFYQSLNLSYQIVGIVSGALNNAAAKKYDLEAWFPYFGHYRELVSCSNCTDYQSRSLEIRCGIKKASLLSL